MPAKRNSNKGESPLKKVAWGEIIVGGIMLASIGWLGNKVYDINSRLSIIEGRLHETVKILAEFHTQTIQKELSEPVTTAIVITKPIKINEYSTKRRIDLFDVSKNKVYKFELVTRRSENNLDSIFGKGLFGLKISGQEIAYGTTVTPFSRYFILQGLGVKPFYSFKLPDYVDPGASFFT